jgi:quercetin dioxygenase-like cupin family protein
MSTITTTPTRLGEPRWFIHNLARIHVDAATTDGRFALVEMSGRRGDMPPLHVHHREDEAFHVLEGRMTLFVGPQTIVVEAGQTAYAPIGIPHVYRVDSETARWLAVASPAGFDGFVLAASDPAPAAEIPPADAPVDLDRVAAAAARAGIELLGPPGTLPS